MERKEAIQITKDLINGNNLEGYENPFDLINKIYDDFEKKSCESCKYCKVSDYRKDELIQCENHWLDDETLYLPLGFLCNRYEKGE